MPATRRPALPRHRRRTRRTFALAAALLIAGLAGPAAAAGIAVGQTLPDAALDGLNGPATRLAAYRGKPLVINVWASWCGPCRAEMASLERLAWYDGAAPFAIIGISTDDDRAAALALLGRAGVSIRHYIDHDLVLEHLLGADTLPLTLLVDAGGRVVQKIHGAQAWDSPAALQLIRQSFGARAAVR